MLSPNTALLGLPNTANTFLSFSEGSVGRGAALVLQVFGNVGVVLALISFGVAILSLVLILYFAKFVP